jgi:hypothetical protein
MALLFADGLDLYDNQADVVAGGITKVEGTTHTHATTGGRYGGGYIGGTTIFPGWGVPCAKAPGSTFWFSFAYYHDGNGSNIGNGDYWIYPRDSVNQQHFILFHKASGEIVVVDQTNAVVGSSAAVLTEDVWHWVEVKVVLGTTDSNGTIEVRVDGALAVSFTGIDTYNTRDTVNLGFYGSSGEWRVDDIIVNDDQGAAFTTPPGDCVIDVIRPNASGSVTDWSGTFADVDDPNGASDGDTTFVESNTIGAASRFSMASLVGVSTSIAGVQPRAKARNTDAGMRAIRTQVRGSAGTVVTGATYTPDTTYAWSRGHFVYTDPDTSVAWTDAGITAVQAGVEVVS